ncbi:MAG: Zn-ribbon domain-containing OB-fold protein [Candidatus Baldrarchaeia archaeon]|mgnify:CR=1 FL=1
MSLEKIRDPERMRRWPGHMETDYVYTVGLAGERFFREIKDNGKFYGTRCEKCGITYFPARTFCERCLSELKEWVEVSPRGYVEMYTIAYMDLEGNKLEKPEIWAFIRFEGVFGGLVHKLGEVKPEEVKIGMVVEPVLKPKEQREGSITDILYFKPAK